MIIKNFKDLICNRISLKKEKISFIHLALIMHLMVFCKKEKNRDNNIEKNKIKKGRKNKKIKMRTNNNKRKVSQLIKRIHKKTRKATNNKQKK